MDHTQDPLYQWCGRQIKRLKREHEATNRREGIRREWLRHEIKQLMDLRDQLRNKPPQMVDYGIF